MNIFLRKQNANILTHPIINHKIKTILKHVLLKNHPFRHSIIQLPADALLSARVGPRERGFFKIVNGHRDASMLMQNARRSEWQVVPLGLSKFCLGDIPGCQPKHVDVLIKLKVTNQTAWRPIVITQ